MQKIMLFSREKIFNDPMIFIKLVCNWITGWSNLLCSLKTVTVTCSSTLLPLGDVWLLFCCRFTSVASLPLKKFGCSFIVILLAFPGSSQFIIGSTLDVAYLVVAFYFGFGPVGGSALEPL